ncbi:SRPBCC family protein [Spirillospora sp. NPDC047279]|uniref:SRPBCC family protein n=1 Tax=Spirillospora sp. NPDC047279 TaxID=3155478 RepID=UPI0033EE54BF
MTAPMTLRARVAAPGKDVRGALTERGPLEVWLAERAAVDLPERYEFWGRYVPEGDRPRQRLTHVDDTSLGFVWTLDGEDTTVEFGVHDQGDGTSLVSLTQTNLPNVMESITGTGSRHLMNTFWSLSLANLVDHLEGREITTRVDFTSPDLREELIIDASRHEVFESLVDSTRFRRWFGANVEIERHVGGRFAMGGFEEDLDPARFLELEPDRKASLKWPDGTVAAWELEDSDGGTRLTFVQSGFGDPDYGSWLGWMSGFAELRRFHELKDWRPIWVEISIEGMPEGMLYTEGQ